MSLKLQQKLKKDVKQLFSSKKKREVNLMYFQTCLILKSNLTLLIQKMIQLLFQNQMKQSLFTVQLIIPVQMLVMVK